MKELLFIDATIRREAESRTWQLCHAFLEEWRKQNPDGIVDHLRLRNQGMRPSLEKDIEMQEEALITQQEMHSSHSRMRYSRQFANADQILIGAPCWDLSFPSLLKVYLEKLCIPGIAFYYTGKEVKPLCKASHCVYLTTCGGSLGRNMGGEYLHELCDTLFGIRDFCQISAEGLDIEGADVEQIMEQAKNRTREAVGR